MERLMRFDDFKAIYRDALKELADPEKQLLHPSASIPRVLEWQKKITPYVFNGTGEDMSIYDKPGSWGHYHHYKLMMDGSDNFFRAKTETINNMK
jgi:hypothetical protein